MLIYILKSGICMVILLLFYKLFLERENVHVFKRFYLLGSLVFALVIPTVVFTEYIEIAAAPDTIPASEALISGLNPGIPAKRETDVFDITVFLWGIYFLGMLFFGIKFLKNLVQIFQRIRSNPKYKKAHFVQVLLQEQMPPHTFFNYIFLNRSQLESNEIPTEVLLHEEAHARERHSLDVVFVELLQLVFWVNPLVYFFKRAIKLNHEFLADRAVLKTEVDASAYQYTLLSFLVPGKGEPLANAINCSITGAQRKRSIEKRFKVMKSQTSKKAIFLRSLLLLPLLVLLLFGFSQKKIIKNYSNDKLEILGDWIEKEHELTTISIFEEDENLLLDYEDSEPLLVEEKDGNFHYISKYPGGQKKHPLVLNEETGLLAFAKRKYIKKGNSLKEKLVGSWENRQNNVKFLVIPSGNGIVWDVIKADGKAVRFYPIKRGDTYGFTYGEESYQWSFKTENGVLYDNQGVAYQRIHERESQEGATKEQMAEYNTLAKKYNELLEQNHIRIRKSDVDRLEYLYGLMSEGQQAGAEPFPDFPKPPEAPEPPKVSNVPKGMTITEVVEAPKPPGPSEKVEETEENIVEKIVQNQEVYDELSADWKMVKETIDQKEYIQAEQKEEQEKNEWIVSSGARRDTRNTTSAQKEVATELPMPPVAPTIAVHADTNTYSKELKKAINEYLKKNRSYEKAVATFLEKKNGNGQHLWNMYNSTMKSYVAYHLLANKEGNYVQPIPAYNERSKKFEPSVPPPPKPKSPLALVLEMKEKNAVFYYEGKEISADEAVELLKKSKNISLEAKHMGLERPVIKLSYGPIDIHKDN